MAPQKLWKKFRVGEWVTEKFIFLTGGLSVAIILLIFLFLLKDALPFFTKFHHSIVEIVGGKEWVPNSDKFGALPLIVGTLMVTFIAIVIALPLGVITALYIGLVAPPKVREILKPTVELIAAIPSVVIGFIGVTLVAPYLFNYSVTHHDIFQMNSSKSAMAAGIMLAFMALPTIVSVAEDALRAVPKEYREGALALGATRWETLWKITLPAASSGVIAAVMLGVGRAIGETMTVLMVAGNSPQIPAGLTAFFQPVRTMTAAIAAEAGDSSQGGSQYSALFVIGLMLFIITFCVNYTADWFVRRNGGK